MGDKTAAVVVTAAEPVAGDIAAAVSEQVERLEQRAERAEIIQDAIIEAAIDGERAERIDDIETELATCRNLMQAQSMALETTQSELSNLSLLLSRNEGDLSELRQAQAEMLETLRALTPPLSTETPEPEALAIIPEQLETAEQEPEAEPETAPKKKHLFL